MKELTVKTFGSMIISTPEAEVSSEGNRSRKAWTLLGYLIYNRHRAVRKSELVELLWGNMDAANSSGALKTLIYRLRSELNNLWEGAGHDLVQSSGDMYRFNSEYQLSVDFEKFEKYIDNLCSFIRVFKDDFQTIEIKKDENGDNYECEIILIYNDGKRINKKYESTGIKKIIEMYSALCNVENGDIVFIDEFDANLHDVLLVKLVEYVMDYTVGQLIFTTHNLAPMDVLQKAKHSIDFCHPIHVLRRGPLMVTIRQLLYIVKD